MSDIRDLIKRIDRTLEAIKCCGKGGSASNIDFTPLINKLEELNQNIQDIEVTAGNISITSDQINLNIDEVESLLQNVVNLLSTTNKIIPRGITTTVNIGTTVLDIITNNFLPLAVNPDKICSISILNEAGKLIMFDVNYGTVNLNQGASFSWSEGENIFIDKDSLGRMIFQTGGLITITFEEQL